MQTGNLDKSLSPPLGKCIDKAKVEPLHTCNNAWQHLFQQMFVIGMKLTNQEVIKKADTFEDLPCTSSLKKFVTCLEQLVKCKRLCNNIRKWYNEKRKKGQDFTYRFTGKESKCFSWNFGHVTETLLQMKPDRNTAFKLHALHKLLKNCVIVSPFSVGQESQKNKFCRWRNLAWNISM